MFLAKKLFITTLLTYKRNFYFSITDVRPLSQSVHVKVKTKTKSVEGTPENIRSKPTLGTMFQLNTINYKSKRRKKIESKKDCTNPLSYKDK